MADSFPTKVETGMDKPKAEPGPHAPDPTLDLKNTFITIDGERYEVAELLKRVVRDLKGE